MAGMAIKADFILILVFDESWKKCLLKQILLKRGLFNEFELTGNSEQECDSSDCVGNDLNERHEILDL